MYTINDIINYFSSIDNINADNRISHDEYLNAKKTNSIFSEILTENMEFTDYCSAFVNKYRDQLDNIDNTNLNECKNLPYKMEKFPEEQDKIWEPITGVLTKEEVDNQRFDIKTPEGEAISPNLNFNSEEGLYMLKHLSFDKEAFKDFPKENLPKGWNPDEIFELGKDPGMNVRKMHKMGYTGKGITVAAIDTPIILHDGIKSSLVGYEVMNNAKALNTPAYFHGQAVSDILCGDETGTAPDSKLVYFAYEDNKNDGLQALRRILEINKQAEENNKPENKIRVVSLSWGFDDDMEGYEEFRTLLKKLYDSGVFVATADFNMLDESITGGKLALGLLDKKEQSDNPNDYNNYRPGVMTPEYYPDNTLFVLSGDRTIASATNDQKYRHDSYGSTSWTIPSLAGIYTCALQCADEHNVKLTPQMFWDYAYKTGKDMYENENLVGRAIDAEALVNEIIKNSETDRTRSFGI